MSDDTRQVQRLLAGFRHPAIPEHLADRIDAALAAEAAIRADREAMSRVIVSSNLISRPDLARQAAKARAESRMLREEMNSLAGTLAETEHAIATTMDQLASQNPRYAAVLGELSRAATQGGVQAAAAGSRASAA